jgi:hypothetical protein
MQRIILPAGGGTTMTERRYSEDEVAEIFRTAADTQEVAGKRVGSNAGMTLAELQEIGREAGISPDAVAYAASLRDRPVAARGRRFLGLPIRVSKAVDLARPLSDPEWEQLVVTLRETFDARGHVSGHGSFRQWTNGNLQIFLEPTATGQRLRMQTVKGNARAQMMAGLGLLGFSAVNAIVGLVNNVGNLDVAAAPIALIGAAFIVTAGSRLPSWALKRSWQMDSIAARAAELAAQPREPSDKSLP